jgi:hypothetical protein
MHFFFEFGSSINGSQYSIQRVISDHFENKIFNLDKFNESNPQLMYIDEINKVEELQMYADYLVDVLYPINRTVINVQVSSTSNHTKEAFATYLSSFNYFCGMQLNVKESLMIPNINSHSKRVFEHVKPLDYSNALSSIFLTSSSLILGQGPNKDQTHS